MLLKNLHYILQHKPLPGLAVQRIMAPIGRFPQGYNPQPPGAKRAAVLLCLSPLPQQQQQQLQQQLEEEDYILPFIKRTPSLSDRHSGQIALPGGKLDVKESFEEAALREAHEEIGLVPDTVTILGRLTPLFIPHSNFSVMPVVGMTHNCPNYSIQETEVQEVIPCKLSLLEAQFNEAKEFHLQSSGGDATNSNTNGVGMLSRRRKLKQVTKAFQAPSFEVPSSTTSGEVHSVWGATAMMVTELLWLIQQARKQM